MTFPCKEEFIQFEELEKLQKQIYPEAADYGILLGDLPNLEDLRGALNEMLKVFKKPEYHYDAQSWGDQLYNGGKSVQFFIPIEMDEGMEVGYDFRIAFCIDHKLRGGGFISIDINRGSHSPVRQ
jgi:hypothetical protein